MATPTPSNTTHGSKYPAHAAQNAPTPNTLAHLAAFSSPAPRSVPSPAAHRMTHSGKSPFNITTQPPGSSGAMTAASHPTSSSGRIGGILGSSPAGVNFDSPSTAALLGHVGGVDMGVSLSQIGGIGMGMSMSGLGLGMDMRASELRRADDEERRKRLELVIATVAKRPGRVCEEGIKRLKDGIGLDFAEDVRLREQRKTLSFAGKVLIVDIDVKSDRIEKVSAEVAGADTWKTASDVLQSNLTADDAVSRINLTLDKFARNLETLARIDKLGTSEFNCFSAIEGVYHSLSKLFQHEKKAALAVIGAEAKNAEEKAEREVMCKRSGRPRMNVGDRVGLALEYWMERRHVVASQTTKKSGFPIASPSESIGLKSDASTMNKTFSIIVEVEANPADMYPAARSSDQWISDSIERSTENTDATQMAQDLSIHGSNIEWMDPPQNTISTSDDAPPDNLNLPSADPGAGRPPPVRFVAKLSPPLVLPVTAAMTLHTQVNPNVHMAPESLRPYESLVLKQNTEVEVLPGFGISNGMKEVRTERTVAVKQQQEGALRKHENALFVPRNEFACVLEEFPFHHPRELVQFLPMFRQYAQLSSLLQRTFMPAPPSSAHSSSLNPSAASLPVLPGHLEFDLSLSHLNPTPSLTAVFSHPSSAGNDKNERGTDMNGDEDDDYAAASDLTSFLAPPTSASASTAKRHETSSGRKASRKRLRVAFEVESNADIVITAQNVFRPTSSNVVGGGEAGGTDKIDGGGEGQDGEETAAGGDEQLTSSSIGLDDARVKKLARALDVCGEFGVWAEWTLQQQ